MSTLLEDSRLADALRHTGSPRYVVRSGPILELMSDLAKEGDLVGVSEAYLAYIAKVPSDRRFVADRVPAKILNQYIYLHRQGSVRAVTKWIARTPGWADRIKEVLEDPERFERVARRMADEAVRED
jgi:hypothetical protein